jgi:hypothetical protein
VNALLRTREMVYGMEVNSRTIIAVGDLHHVLESLQDLLASSS